MVLTSRLPRSAELDRLQTTARAILNDPGTVILDTETTGLDNMARICEIAILKADGTEVFNKRVNPEVPIGYTAQRIHGLTPETLSDEPNWAHRFPEVVSAMRDAKASQVVIYNAQYDTRLVRQSTAAYPELGAMADEFWNTYPYKCAMAAYSVWCGVWDEYCESYRWPKLPGGDHSAMGDCRATLAVIQDIAN